MSPLDARSSAIDMSPSAIEVRLARVSALSPLGFRPPPQVDMSPEAIESRLEEWAELTAMCLELSRRPPPITEPPLPSG